MGHVDSEIVPMLETCTCQKYLILDGIGDQLCGRVLSVLFEMWLLACTRSFPPPPLWKTFRDMCSNWRHHEAPVIQWYRVNVALSAKLLKIMYGPDYPELHASKWYNAHMERRGRA